MFLPQQTWYFACWLTSLWKKIFQISPLSGTLTVILLLIADVSLILSFILPLKVVMLAGSDGTPWYFRELFGDVNRDRLIVALSISTVLFYVLYLSANYFASNSIVQGSRRLLARSRKVTLFEEQDQLAERFFRKVSDSQAAVLFAVLALILGLWLNTMAFGSLLLLVGLVFASATMLAGSEPGQNWLLRHYHSWLKVSSGIVFLLFFGVMLSQFLLGTLSNLILAIGSLLLGRQIVQRSMTFCVGAVTLSQDRPKIDALFFPQRQFLNIESRQQFGFWEYVAREGREYRLAEILAEGIGRGVSEVEARWYQLGIRNVVGFDTVCTVEGERKRYFLKLFGPGRGARAQHEASLLGERWSSELPAPQLVGFVADPRFQALVFDGPRGELPRGPAAAHMQRFIFQSAWCVTPPEEVVDRFHRSKPLLTERIGDKFLNRLADAASTNKHVELLPAFREALPQLLGMVDELPLHVLIPPPNRDQLIVEANERVMALDWSSWSLEPVGAGWPRNAMSQLPDGLAWAADRRRELAHADTSQVIVAAMLFQMEQYFKQQQYVSVLDMLPDILDVARRESAWSSAIF